MPTSVMPKGVEHMTLDVSDATLTSMPTSVMPKGVEHAKLPLELADQQLVCPPL